MFDDKDRKYRSYSIYTDTSRMKRRNGSIDFISSGNVPTRDLYHMPIKPKKDKNNEIQKKFFDESYCYLYENPPYILYFIVNDLKDDNFSEEVKERIGFDFRDEYFLPKRDIKSLVVFELLEDMILGNDFKHKNVLETVVNQLRNYNSISEAFDKEFDFSSNIGTSKYDECMRLLVDIVYSFVDSQNVSTKVYQKTHSGCIPVPSFYNSSIERKIDTFEINSKKRALDSYYKVLSYRNCMGGGVSIKDKGINYEFPIPERTLVSSNLYVKALQSFFGINDITKSFEKSIYFKLHDELPWMNNCICNSIHGVEEGCGADFRVKEEDIFYRDDKFNVICPCCGAICTTGIMPGKFKDRIEERIKKRFVDDKFFDRKISLLSELYSMGSIVVENGKKKIKE